MKKKKKLKLKKQAYYLFAFLVVIIVSVILGINYYNDYQYKQTIEYKFLEKGYSFSDSQLIQEKLSDENVNKLLNEDKNESIISLLEQKYFLEKNLDTYLSYIAKEETTDYKDVIAIVNVHAENKWYAIELESDTSLNELMNVNKFYALSSAYTPENLKSISLDYSYGNYGDNQLIDYAYEKFIDLWQAANEAGHYFMVNSSYRNYEDQKETYDNLKNTLGERKADEIAAHAGHSEHQSGLVVDMTSKDAPNASTFKESEAYQWLKENAYKYGWIERYPEEKTYLTGYSAESWHWRYVGVEAATIMYEEDITFDEYYAYYVEK